MAVTIPSHSHGNTSAAQTSLTVSHTVTAGAEGLVVGVACFSILAAAPTVTYGGVSMTRVSSLGISSGTYQFFVFVLGTPTSGTANVVLSGTSQYWALAAWDIESGGLNVSANVNRATGTSITTDGASMVDALVVDLIAADNTNQTFTVGGSQSSLFEDDNVANGNIHLASSTRAGASPTQAMSWTVGTSDALGHLVISIPPTGGGSGGGEHAAVFVS